MTNWITVNLKDGAKLNINLDTCSDIIQAEGNITLMREAEIVHVFSGEDAITFESILCSLGVLRTTLNTACYEKLPARNPQPLYQSNLKREKWDVDMIVLAASYVLLMIFMLLTCIVK